MQFDPMQYLDAETNVASEKRAPLPVGDYTAITGEPKVEPWSGKPGSAAEGKSGMMVLIPLKVTVPPAVVEELNYRSNELTFTDRLFLDLTDGGAIDWSPGQNKGLRRYRIALDMNNPGESFSIRRLAGRPLKVRMDHELYQGEVQERIGGVAHI